MSNHKEDTENKQVSNEANKKMASEETAIKGNNVEMNSEEIFIGSCGNLCKECKTCKHQNNQLFKNG
jgi:hypothetical protein